MRMKAYEAYRESGVEWIGRVPIRWDLKPIWSVATCNDEVLHEDTDPDFEIEYIEISDVDSVSGIAGSARLLFSEAPSRARRRVKEGDIIVSTVRTYLRAIAGINQPPANTIVSTGFAVFRPKRFIPNF